MGGSVLPLPSKKRSSSSPAPSPYPHLHPATHGRFHLILACAMTYMAMLLTDWGAGTSGSETAMWVKIVTSWVTMILYGWSLAAPHCCPDRFQSEGV